MRTHTNDFKNELVQFGREFGDIITYNGVTLSMEDVKSVNYSVKSSLMKSVMKELKIDTTTEMTKGDVIGYQLGVKVNGSYEYLNYGNYIVEKIEKQEDKRSWLVTCYDKMLLTMVNYEDLSEYQLTEDTEFVEDKTYYESSDDEYVAYDDDRTGDPNALGLYELASIFPLTIREYIGKICSHLGITFANENDTFINYDKTLSNELYLDSEGNSLGYTFRDVLDELAQVTGSFICINNDDELEVRYITEATSGGSSGIPVTYTFTTDIESGSKYVITNNNNVDTAKSLNNDISYIALSTEDAPSSNGWIFTASGTGYTIKNKQSGLFLGLSGSNTLTTSSTEYVWTWASANRRLTTQSTGGFVRTYYLRYNNGWQVSTTAGSIYLATYTGGEEEVERDVINEDYFNDTNVNVGKKYGPINSLVFSRSADSDNIGLTNPESIEENGLCEVKISDNQILNDNNRDEYLEDLFEYLNGIYYYLNDYDLKGVLYYEIGDMYDVSIFGNTYQCLLLNDEINRSPGVKETIYSEEPETNVSDYKSMSKTDRTINQAYIIVNKQEGTITSLVSKTNTIDTTMNNNYQELNNKFDGYTPLSRTAEIENSVTTLQTDTYTKTDVNSILKGTFYDEDNNQIVTEIVQTTSGTFDENGMTYEKTNANTKTTINEVGVGVKKTDGSDDYILFAGYVNSGNTQFGDFEGQTVVASENMIVKNYFVVGENSRMEDYEDGTGMFYIGG